MSKDLKCALIIVDSVIARDPRVRRQIDSLASEGWIVDTIGVGDHPAAEVRDHFPLMRIRGWLRSTVGTLFVHGFLPHSLRFKLLVSDRVSPEVADRISSGAYQLIVFNDLDFMPWIANPSTFTARALNAHIHLDIHEYFPPEVKKDTLYRRFIASYNVWLRKHIGDQRFTTRSTPVRGISSLYADEFGFAPPAVIRSCPPFVEQSPRPVDPHEIKLLYHGAINPHRGVYEIVDAMRLLDERFTMTFITVGGAAQIADVKAYAHGMLDRIKFVDPVPVDEIGSFINQFDLEVMFFPWHTTNLKLALPNKFFEAIQGRLGVVIGESPMMKELVDENQLGLNVTGWSGKDLAAGISTLTAQQITEFKLAAHKVAPAFSAESERQAFLSIVQANDKPQTPHG